MRRRPPEGLQALELHVAGRGAARVLGAVAADPAVVLSTDGAALLQLRRAGGADAGVRRLLDAVDALPPTVRAAWDRVRTRRVDLVLLPKRGGPGFSTTARLSEATVRRLGASGVDVGIRVLPVAAGPPTERGRFMEVLFLVYGSRALWRVADHVAWSTVCEHPRSTVLDFRERVGGGRQEVRSLEAGLRTVEAFPGRVRALYDQARARVADLGYDGAVGGPAVEATVPAALLRRLGAAGFELHVTTYPPVEPAAAGGDPGACCGVGP
jgi:hypothetical protein